MYELLSGENTWLVAPSELLLVFVAVNKSTREARLIGRGLTHREQWQQFEAHSTETQVQTVLRAIADFTVDSTQKIEELVKEIVTWVQQLREEITIFDADENQR